MNILIIGLGSIGQRHLRNIKLLKPKANIYSLRKKNKSILIQNKRILKKKDILKFYNIKKINLKDLKKINIDSTFICNPSSMHMKYAKYFIKKKSHLFVEKPLAGSMRDLKKLLKLNKRIKKNITIGHQFRHNPLIKFTKNILEKNSFGKILSAKFENLSFLPHFHPYEDYRKSYAAKKKLGGGVVDTLTHEIDLIAYFFGMPEKIQKIEKKSGILDADINDIFEGLFIYRKLNKFSVSLSLSLSEIDKRRSFKIAFEKKTLLCNLINNTLQIRSNFSGKILKKIKYKKDINNFYISEIKNFFKNLKKKYPSHLSLEKNLKTEYLYHKIKS